MKMSRTIAYAVQAVLQLAAIESTSPVSCNHLAREGQMPERFLLQVLRSLVRGGVLKSVRGAEGGYRLARPPAEITLLDIFEAMDSPLIPSVPPLEGLTDETRQALLDVLTRSCGQARSAFAGLTIAALAVHQVKPEGDYRPLDEQPTAESEDSNPEDQ